MARGVVAVVGSETLLGREVRELLSGSDLEIDLRLVASDEDKAKAAAEEEDEDEPLDMAGLQSDAIADAAVVLLCGSTQSSQRTLALIRNGGLRVQIVDTTGALEEDPAALLRAPLAIAEQIERTEGAIDVIAHPAAIALARFFARLSETGGPARAVVTIFEPASERGQKGMDELQQQTIGLLSFKPLKKEVFDEQVSFNMLAAFGEDAPRSLAEVEGRIERNLATLVSRMQGVPMPSLRLVQAPVFHGYSALVWAEFDTPPNPAALEQQLASGDIDVRAAGQEPPTNVGMAGQAGIAVGAIARDRNDPRACWFWVVADNLRIVAENCLEVVRELVA